MREELAANAGHTKDFFQVPQLATMVRNDSRRYKKLADVIEQN